MAITIVTTAAFGLEAVVARELADLGYGDPKPRAVAGRLRFEADELALCRCNLWLRSADRVMVEVGNFSAPDFDALFELTKALPWEEWLPKNACFPVNAKSVRSQLTSIPAVQRSVKKAIADRLASVYGLVQLPEDGPLFQIQASLLNNRASLLLDASGSGLHKRGYGEEVGVAPLKETMAAGLVQVSFWKPDRPLLDPFCGGGTIPIEAAMIGRNMAPGRTRRFDGERWPRIGDANWAQARTEAEDLEKLNLPLEILASDVDPGAVALAERRAQAAGVGDTIRFSTSDVCDLGELPEYGCLIANPPYGERMGNEREVVALYRELPRVFAKMPTWSLYMITSVMEAEEIFGRKADKRRKLYNGRLACTYFQFYGPRPPRTDGGVSQKAAPAFGALPERAEKQAELLTVRLRKRARHYRRWPTKQGITCFRLYDRDVPGVPLVIDRYEDAWHVTDYTPPDFYPPDKHESWLALMRQTIADTLEAPLDLVFVKHRRRQSGRTQHEKRAKRKQIFVVNEGGLRFEVNLSDYVDTGLFSDHRQTREMVRQEAAGKDVLNLFCYTGSFTVYAAAGNARSTCSVDLSNTYLDWTRRNLLLNDLDGPQHRVERSDVLPFLLRERKEYDLVIVDPPTFSNSKSTEGTWEVQRDHAELLAAVMDCLRPGGICYFSNNLRKFTFDAPAISETHDVREITNQTLPPDYEGSRTGHRCWRIVKA